MTDTTEMDALAQRIVQSDVHLCQTALVEELLKSEEWQAKGFGIEDIENLDHYTLEDETGCEVTLTPAARELEMERCREGLESAELADYLERLESAEPEMREIYEWWVVSNWLAEKLREQGEPILDNDWGLWWGRCTTGQAIYMDGVIQRIARRL